MRLLQAVGITKTASTGDTGDPSVCARLDRLAWSEGLLRIEGHAWLRGGRAPSSDHLALWLERRSGERRIDLPVTVTPRGKGMSFAATIDPAAFRKGADWALGGWAVRIELADGGSLRSGPLTEFGAGRAHWPARDEPGGVRLQAARTGAGELEIRLRQLPAMVTGCRRLGEGAELTGWIGGDPAGSRTVTVASRDDVSLMSLPVTVTGSAFVFLLPVGDLAGEGRDTQWEFRLDGRRLAIAGDLPELRCGFGERTVALTRTRNGNLTAVERSAGLVLTGVRWEAAALCLDGDSELPAAERPRSLTLCHRATGARRDLPLVWEERAFRAEFEPGAMCGLAGVLPLASGTWDLESVIAERALLETLAPMERAGGHEYEVRAGQAETIYLHSALARPADERGKQAQEHLREHDYPAFLRREVRDLVVFESYFGKQYSCNPKALYEELLRRDTGHKLVWISGDGQFVPPEGCGVVLRHSRDYYEALASARYVVNNCAHPVSYVKRPDQFYLQTWHGTPIKRVGFDMDWSRIVRGEERLRNFAADIARWDLLLTQNPLSTRVLREALRYEGEIFESGYPRNDLLRSADRSEMGLLVRKRLGIPEGKRVVLYAPTWRDNLQSAGHLQEQRLPLDLEQAQAELGDDCVLLLRLHHLLNARVPTSPFVFDVTTYPDVSELFLASDVLITDYSSLVCDFVGLDRPVLMFAHDLEAYRDDIRGFTFDLTQNAPGPILRTSDEVIEALADIERVGRESAAARRSFAREFAPHDDGQVAARVIDRLLAAG